MPPQHRTGPELPDPAGETPPPASAPQGLRHIYFIRHGMREDFENPGWRALAANPDDPPLSATGCGQAADIARALGGSGIAHIISSPFLRALETAEPLAMATNLPIFIEPGFCEWLNPAWFDAKPRWLAAREAAARFPSVDPRFPALLEPVFPEQDETVEVFARVRRTLDLLLSRYPSGNIAVFAHGSPLGQAIAALTGTLEGVDLRTASITQIALGDGTPRIVASGSGHLRDTDTSVRFH